MHISIYVPKEKWLEVRGVRVRDVGCGEVSKSGRGRGLRVIPLLMTSDILQHDEMIRVARCPTPAPVCVCVCVCVYVCVCVCVCVYSLSLVRENHQRR